MSRATPPRPSPVDRHLHRATRALPHHGGYLGFLAFLEGRPPGIDELRDVVADAVTRVPAWRYRVCGDNRRVWEPAHGQDPRGHVHELRLPEGPATLEGIARAAYEAPFPEGADNWGVWLVTGWAPGRYALACRVHHALQDGLGAMAGVGAFMLPGLELPLSVPPDAEPPFRLAGTARWAARTLPALLRPTARWTPARQEAGTTRTLHLTSCGTERLKALARAADASLNQVYLAVTAGALRAWTPQDWSARGAGPLHAFVPAESRPPGHGSATLGNHLVALRAELHCGEPDPRRRLDRMRESTDRRGAQIPHQRAALRALPRVADLATRCLLHPSRTALLTTNVPLGAGLLLNGDPVRQIVGLPPLLFGQPLTVLLTTYEEQATVCFTSDRGDPDPGRLPQLWQSALTELEEAYAPVPPR
ncbi:wax ester/triacylglycerol synthase domain-containing protein [Streptomyces sp. NPDC018059]|uniref:wax ester/triacylglycerol synthase domain-containing protein n=1 Tax=Streptomyces sp. NPDC018059 TaxID=3365041 RepID=UPI0037926234